MAVGSVLEDADRGDQPFLEQAMAVRPLIAGNWKMNLLKADGMALASALAAHMKQERGLDMAVCPPAQLLAPVAACLEGSGLGLGGQDCHEQVSGAHTGDISAAMLADIGCGYAIVGHSERRADHGESDAVVRAKASAAHGAGLIAIICVGETEAERDAGQAMTVVDRQLRGSMPEGATAANTVVAYEPVWAIGTGKTATTDDIAEIHGHARAVVSQIAENGAVMRILYGGSVKPGNAAEILGVADVGGALVGGASLVAEDFIAIAEAAPV
jgi:triosephosphate isomerase (TIM)